MHKNQCVISILWLYQSDELSDRNSHGDVHNYAVVGNGSGREIAPVTVGIQQMLQQTGIVRT